MKYNTNYEENKVLNRKNCLDIINNVLINLKNEDYLKKYVIGTNNFCRHRCLPLVDMASLVFARASESLSVFLDTHCNSKVTKQAFSKARKKIDSILFRDLNKIFVKDRYKFDYKKYHGKYVLFGIDGTTIEIPNILILKQDFGQSAGQQGAKTVARASASCIYDLNNKIIVESTIEKHNTSERVMAKKMIKNIKKEIKDKECIFIMDRGYFSKEMLYYLMKNNYYFLFRLRNNVLRKYFKKMKNKDEWFEVELADIPGTINEKDVNQRKKVKFRLTKIKLNNNEEEYLISNIEDVKYEEMKELYFMRWQIEENYKYLKSKMMIENFSGKTKITIEQEFYASILTANMLYLIEQSSEKKRQKNINIK